MRTFASLFALCAFLAAGTARATPEPDAEAPRQHGQTEKKKKEGEDKAGTPAKKSAKHATPTKPVAKASKADIKAHGKTAAKADDKAHGKTATKVVASAGKQNGKSSKVILRDPDEGGGDDAQSELSAEEIKERTDKAARAEEERRAAEKRKEEAERAYNQCVSDANNDYGKCSAGEKSDEELTKCNDTVSSDLAHCRSLK